MKNKTLLKQNAIYQATYETMENYLYAYLGGESFKKSVRKKRPSEDSNLYTDLIKNTVAQPIARYVVETLNDVVFEPGIKRDIRFATPAGTAINPETCDWAELFMLDADLTNRTLSGVMELIGETSSIFGHCWVFVDMPTAEQGNLGRPYVCVLSPLDVWDWEFDTYGGRQILEYVKIKEGEDDDCYYLKTFKLGDAFSPTSWQSWEVSKLHPEHDAKLLGEGLFPAGMAIPGFIAYGRRDPRLLDVGVSDIDAASDAQREHYKLECEAYQSIQFAKTLIRADKGIQIAAHAGAIVRATQGQVESIAVDTGDVDKIIQKQADILEQIEALTGVGGLRTTKNQVQSGVSIIEERRNLHRTAKGKARLLEITEELIWTFAARFMDMRWAGEVTFSTNYEKSDTNYRLAILNQAKTLAPDNELIRDMAVVELLKLLAPEQEENEFIQAAKPTFSPVMQTLMQEQEAEVYSRDLGSQIPEERMMEPDQSELEEQDTGEDETGSSQIVNVGATYEAQQAIAVQISGLNTGR